MKDEHSRWSRVLPDLLGTGVALALAWFMGWRTGDLIWSMWLASLVIGYSLILWKIFSPVIPLFQQRREIGEYARESPVGTAAGLGALLFGKLLLLAFFTVHFGGFHWGHSIFVNSFYPISPDVTGSEFSPGLRDYWTVVKDYGWFIPLAFFAQRGLFELQKDRAIPKGDAPDAAKTRGRSARSGRHGKTPAGPDMGTAYRGVIKLHLLIFFLFGADAAGLPEWLTFIVVYLVYFLDWRELVSGDDGQKDLPPSDTSRRRRR